MERERQAAQLKFEQSATLLQAAEKARKQANADREKASLKQCVRAGSWTLKISRPKSY